MGVIVFVISFIEEDDKRISIVLIKVKIIKIEEYLSWEMIEFNNLIFLIFIKINIPEMRKIDKDKIILGR